MDDKIKQELDRIIDNKERSVKYIRTSTVSQLLHDLRIYTDEVFNEAILYLEDKGLNINVDDGERDKHSFLDYSKISIVPKTLSVESIVKKLKYNEINLDTEFQRKRNLWSDEVKSQLIESFMVQLPIPPLYFDGKQPDNWLVIDGLQRLCTLKGFLLDESFVLTGLEYLSDYDGFSFKQLPRIYQRRIEEAQIALYLILPDTPDEVKYSLFKRINTPGLTLESQEIRHALFRGPANIFLKELAESKDFCVVTDSDVPTERMQDQEVVLRYFALKYLKEDVFKNSTLDQYLYKAMGFLDEQDEAFFMVNKELFLDSLKACYKIFGKYSFRRISKLKPQDKKPFNSALFESWMVAISNLDGENRKILEKRGERLKRLYIDELDKKATFYSDIGSGKYRSFVRRNETIRSLIREALGDGRETENT